MSKNKLLLLLALLLTAATGPAWAQGPWTSGACTVTFSDGVMTVSGTGAMADYADYNYTPWSSYDVETIVIESGVTSIGKFALSRFRNLESVSIPASVTSIGEEAFENCGSYAEALTVSFAEGSTPLTIGESAFYNANLKSIDIPNRVTSIGNYAFQSCSNLESVSIPASVTSIGERAFCYCSKLAKVSIYAPSLTTYGAAAFDDNATGRKIYVLPKAVDTYKAGWPDYAADIEAMPGYGYTVTLKSGTEDATKWQGKADTGDYQALPLTGVEAGTAVTVKYFGTKKVESVKAVKNLGHALSASAVGEIVGTDGKAYAVADKDNLPEGVTAVAMIAYVSGSNGLAIALADESAMEWAQAKSTCEGKDAIGGNSWKLPSQEEWNQMFSANGGSYTGLNNALAAAGGESSKLQEWEEYWSSSSYDGQNARVVTFKSGAVSWGVTYKESNDRFRACLAF